VLNSGQELVVQVVKDERDAKGATLTTNLSIPGRYLVLMIGNQRGGVSRKISDESKRHKLRRAIDSLKIPPGMGVIVRTAGLNKDSEDLQHDLDNLLETWFHILEGSSNTKNPLLLYKEADLACRMIRDYYTTDIEEILIDDRGTFERASVFVERIMPHVKPILKFYEGQRPIFSHFHLDNQVDEIYHPEVTLPSGGSIVITPTEAIVSIDVNSGRATGQSDVEETAFETNREAAEAIAQQLRLRDLGGLVVIDFIDMVDRRHKQIVEKVLKEATQKDKAKVEIGRLSKFGLLEMSRQRLKSSLSSQHQTCCPHCNGRGQIRTSESVALEALRKIQSAVFAGGVEKVKVRMAPAGALMLLNSKRQILSQLEQQTGAEIVIIADGRMKSDDYDLLLETAHEQQQIQSPSLRTPEQSRDSRNESRPRGAQGNDRRNNNNNKRGGRNNRRRNDRGRRRNNDNRQGPREAGEANNGGENAGTQQPQSAVTTANTSEPKQEIAKKEAPVAAPVVTQA
jgi:ribonuclease E